MKERPIIFSGPMVRAILAGRKTQTRRLVKWHGGGDRQDTLHASPAVRMTAYPKTGELLAQFDHPRGGPLTGLLSPYGQSGDRLWVRESYRRSQHGEGEPIYMADVGDYERTEKGPWKPAIYMPRDVARIVLDVTEVRVERLQDISEADAKAEGVELMLGERGLDAEQPILGEQRGRTLGTHPYTLEYAVLWDTINGDRCTWVKNPWVWVVGFGRVEV